MWFESSTELDAGCRRDKSQGLALKELRSSKGGRSINETVDCGVIETKRETHTQQGSGKRGRETSLTYPSAVKPLYSFLKGNWLTWSWPGRRGKLGNPVIIPRHHNGYECSVNSTLFLNHLIMQHSPIESMEDIAYNFINWASWSLALVSLPHPHPRPRRVFWK